MSEIRWDGLGALETALTRFGAHVAEEVTPIVAGAAREMHGTLMARFPLNDGPTGNLRRGNRIQQYGALQWRVYNFAQHASWYDAGFDHVSGRRVQGKDVFVPAAVSIRQRMDGRLNGVIAKVSGRSGGVLVGA